ncbi:pentatricopeptide repeat-containing protein At3g26782, mitochondrial-like [Selaginella moellendorffii]|uniref:pentatricopeptide repeat-containing protein At3g26782, mitochondrial-like n=1 Tax=Selaginella moellendorffii TaxID=88036 RepID=UPI000D1C94FE|nr:pentatricopeptide repeat-containing protein At3g26782, mitochondrial-like [Selaginella moellendorffii]|eukprot:XP_024519070.1 pentatricopeptide repeat-containing protein At3g26782, mitochondrial-like [Selaginella moellendorffii]
MARVLRRSFSLWPKFPDFKHSTTGECLWLNARECPEWVHSKLASLKTLAAGQSGRAQYKKREIETNHGSSSLQLAQPVSTLPCSSQKRDASGVTAASVLAALKSCRSSTHLSTGKELHRQADECGLVSNPFMACSLIAMYGRCGSMPLAQQLFDGMPQHDVFTWNSLILGYVTAGDSDAALRLFDAMDCEPDARSFVFALKACAGLAAREGKDPVLGKLVKKRCLERGMALHAAAAKRGFVSDLYVASTMVDMYAKCGSMAQARNVFDEMKERNAVSWTALMLGYVENGEDLLALELFERMKEDRSCVVDAKVLVAALMACAKLAATGSSKEILDKGRELHARARKSGLINSFVESTLVSMYSKCGSMTEARAVFDQMVSPDTVTVNSLMLGYVDNEESESALELVRSCVIPDSRTLVAGLAACARCAKKNPADKPKFLKLGQDFHSQALQDPERLLDIYVQTTLVDMYSSCGSTSEARAVFDGIDLGSRTVATWNAMLLGYAENGESALALDLYRQMTRSSCQANSITLVAALMACGNLMALDAGRAIILEDQGGAKLLQKGGGGHDPFLAATSVINFYAKCGDIEEAERAFNEMPVKDTAARNALLSAYSQQGDSSRACDVFDKMVDENVGVDKVTLVCVLRACSRGGLVARGKAYFHTMAKVYGITPTLEHYGCMVDLLGRAGLIGEAVDMVRAMPYEPDVAVWTAVLSACRKWGSVEFGKVAFEALVGLDPTNSIPYVLMAQIYRTVGMEDKQEQVERTRKLAGAWKKAGESFWVDGADKTHSFVVGDVVSHPRSEDILVKLKSLHARIKSKHKKLTKVEEDDDDAEAHSERLAVVFALISTSKNATVRIVNNMRMCEGCHRVCKAIAKLEGRRIIVRDTSVIHVFDGRKEECSCGDSW